MTGAPTPPGVVRTLAPARVLAPVTVARALAPLAVVGALLGPLAAAAAGADALATVAPPWSPPGGGLLLGTDALGRDVAARVLAGGAGLTLVAMAGGLAATLPGTAGGLLVGWSGGRVARAATGAADVLLAVPLLLLALVAAVALPGPAAVVTATAVAGAPLTLRVVADVTRHATGTGYVRAALARGERPATVLVREVLPAHAGLVAADLGMRTLLALQLAAAFAVLGLGPAPPAPDWAAMLRENLPGIALNPAAVLAPASALAAVAVALAAGAEAAGRRAGGGP